MYINRYRDRIHFVQEGDPKEGLFSLKITTPMGEKRYPQRYGMYEDGTLSFVDPSGGPFITIGTNLAHYDESLPKSIVEKIYEKDDKTYLQCKIESMNSESNSNL